MAFGSDIKRIRLASGLSGRQLAEKLGINADRLKQWELKDFDPRMEDRTIIEKEFRMKLEEIKKLKKIPEHVLAPNATGEVPVGNQIPTDFQLSLGEKYKRGQRFSKIIGEIIKTGTTLEILRDEILKVQGRQLSKMYMGLTPVPDFIIEILEEKFNINSKYLSNSKEPIFLSPSDKVTNKHADNSSTLKYYTVGMKGQVKHNADILPKKEAEAELLISDLFKGSQYVIKINDNSMTPNYPSGSIVGIREIPDKIIQPGSVYVIEKDNDLWIKRLFYVNDDQQTGKLECISDNNLLYDHGSRKGKLYYPPFTIEINKIKRLFKVTGIYKPDDLTVVTK